MKPLGGRAYGSIPHLPNSRLGPKDHHIDAGQARICTEKARDFKDHIVVQEKLDGSCTAVAKINGAIVALNRAGYLASSSQYGVHHQFNGWVISNEGRFLQALEEGERLVGEWLGMAHGTMYELEHKSPWAYFDLMRGKRRATRDELVSRIGHRFSFPTIIHEGGPISVEAAMKIHEKHRWPSDGPEGLVYRVERDGEVDFLAKWVRRDKVDGKYLPSVTGKGPVWLWG